MVKSVSCKVRDAGKCRRVKCGESAGSHPAIYTYEHTLNECSSTHCVAQESSCREVVTVINRESPSRRTIQRLLLRARLYTATYQCILILRLCLQYGNSYHNCQYFRTGTRKPRSVKDSTGTHTIKIVSPVREPVL